MLVLVAMALTAAVIPGGCGGKRAATPEAAARGFLEALEAGDMKAAADLVAWHEMARASNPDWDSFPTSQKNLIVSRVREQSQGSLEALAGLLQGAQVGETSSSGGATAVTVTSGATQFMLGAIETDKGWKVLLPGGV